MRLEYWELLGGGCFRGQQDIRRRLEQRWLPGERYVGLLTSVAVTDWVCGTADPPMTEMHRRLWGQWQSRAVLWGFLCYHYC